MSNPDQIPLYPLQFEPIYQYRLWGGRRLANLVSNPLPPDIPIGEAWILSDRDDHASIVTNGPLKGKTIGELLRQSPIQMLGELGRHSCRFPLLFKFLDVSKTLSVQVHPSDVHPELIPVGETGKTEAWVVLEKGGEGRIYAGLKPSTTAEELVASIAGGTVADQLSSFEPRPGDGILVQAGTVHSLRDVVVFEVQQNSDVTYRLFDWNHVDPKTGEQRPLQVNQALACIDYDQVAIGPIAPTLEEMTPVLRETLIHCSHFSVSRVQGESPFIVGATGVARVLVCIAGEGHLDHGGADYAFAKGNIHLLPAVVGACTCLPDGAVNVLEISLPEVS